MNAADPQKTDGELVTEILTAPAAAQESYRVLMERYWKTIVVLARTRVPGERDAEDVAQEAFTRAFLSLRKLQDPRLFLGWLLRIASNLAIDHMRRRRPTTSLQELGPAEADADRRFTPSEDAHARLERAEELDLVRHALPEVPERYRTVLALRYLQGLSNQEIAAALGEPEGTIRNRLFRALGKLRQILDARGVNSHE